LVVIADFDADECRALHHFTPQAALLTSAPGGFSMTTPKPK